MPPVTEPTLLQTVPDLRVVADRWLDVLVFNLPRFAAAVLVFVIGLYVAKGVGRMAQRSLDRTARDARAGEAWGTLVRYLVVVLVIVAALAVGGVNLAALMVAVGAIGFGLAFAMQDIIANLMSGLIILTTHPFGVGDGVEIGSGTAGKVEEVGLRSTKMRTWDGLRVEVPNKEVLNSPITVYTYFGERRVDVLVGISYDDDIPGAVQTAVDAVRGHEGVLDEPEPMVLVDELGGSSVNLRVRFWVETREHNWVQTRGEVTRAVKEALDDAGFDIPFPIRTVYMHEDPSAAKNGEGAADDGAREAPVGSGRP